MAPPPPPLQEQKDAANAQIKAMDAARDSARAQQKSIRDKCKYVSVAQVDEAVARLEDKMAHTTMSLNDEKKIIQQLSDLKKSRQFVQQYSAVKDAAAGDAGGREGAMARVKAVNEKIKALKQREDAQKKEIEAIREKVGGEKDDIPDLIKEKQAKWEMIVQCREAQDKLWEDFKKKEDAYWDTELLYRAWEKVEKQKKWEAGKEERARRDAERKAREEAMRPDPYTEEIMLCEQLTVYLSRFTATKAAPAPEAAPEAEAPSGARLLKRDTEELDIMYTGTGKGKKAKGSKKAKKPANLNHTFDILSSFAKCKVTPPLVAEGAAAAAEALTERKAVFEKLQKGALEKRAKEKEEAEKNAAAEAAAAEATTSSDAADAAESGNSSGNGAAENGAAGEKAEANGGAAGANGAAEA